VAYRYLELPVQRKGVSHAQQPLTSRNRLGRYARRDRIHVLLRCKRHQVEAEQTSARCQYHRPLRQNAAHGLRGHSRDRSSQHRSALPLRSLANLARDHLDRLRTHSRRDHDSESELLVRRGDERRLDTPPISEAALKALPGVAVFCFQYCRLYLTYMFYNVKICLLSST
jgi:hypothetical protein